MRKSSGSILHSYIYDSLLNIKNSKDFLIGKIVTSRILFLFFDQNVIFFLIYLAFSFLGNIYSYEGFIQNYFFYCILMFEIFNKLATLRELVYTLGRIFFKLINIAILLFLVLYIYTIIAFIYFRKDYLAVMYLNIRMITVIILQ